MLTFIFGFLLGILTTMLVIRHLFLKEMCKVFDRPMSQRHLIGGDLQELREGLVDMAKHFEGEVNKGLSEEEKALAKRIMEDIVKVPYSLRRRL